MKTKDNELLTAPIILLLVAPVFFCLNQKPSAMWLLGGVGVSLFCWGAIQLTYWLEGKATAKVNAQFAVEQVHYPNGAYAIKVGGHIKYIRYNTGDQVWLGYIKDKSFVQNAITHDGINWNEKFGR